MNIKWNKTSSERYAGKGNSGIEYAVGQATQYLYYCKCGLEMFNKPTFAEAIRFCQDYEDSITSYCKPKMVGI